MIRGGILSRGVTDLSIIDGTVDIANALFLEDWRLQQDNAR